jgi:hypothetical protein
MSIRVGSTGLALPKGVTPAETREDGFSSDNSIDVYLRQRACTWRDGRPQGSIKLVYGNPNR